ncbi:MAG: class I SAM-dependent methyltransferase, partial [Chloroflexota bacterium]
AEMTYDKQFDVVWANASLLHLPSKQLPTVFESVAKALKKNGIFYCSFKVGDHEGIVDDGRHFTYFTEARMRDFVAQFPEFLIERIVITPDKRPKYRDWLNVYIRYVG